MKKSLVIGTLAAGHGLNDLIAGYFLGVQAQLKTDLLQIGMGLFLYNLIAFGGQYPVALWMEKAGKPKQFLLIAYALNVGAVLLFSFLPPLSIVLTGLASAIYHVAGGSVCAEQNKAVNIGLFAAPGVAGLIAGGYFAFIGISILPSLVIAAILFLFVLFKLPLKSPDRAKDTEPDINRKFSLDNHDIIMILLLTVISLRSAIWNIFQLLHENNYKWLIAIAAAAVAGKIAGGWLADKIGWRLYIILSLTASTPLLTFFKNEVLLFCIGIGLLQSGIPATTALLIQSMKGKTERAIGLSFGTAIIAGAVIFYIPALQFIQPDMFVCGITIAMLLIMFFLKKHLSGFTRQE